MVNVRIANINDYKDITAIWNKNTSVLFRYFKSELEQEIKANKYVVATYENDIVGFVGYRFMPRKQIIKIIHLCVSKEHRNNGIGKILLNSIIDKARKDIISIVEYPIQIECVDGAENNLFWEKQGKLLYVKELNKMNIRVYELKGR